ncbi:MAG: hypothetical protein PHF11_07170, partial [Candidatus Omnitrophica bacterium]|nr:hypothetical protein [Candidatus Omnitrophota bacterium]
MRLILIVVVILGIAWIGWIKYQEKTRVPVALSLIDKKMEELKSAGFDNLAQNVGTGFIEENTVIDGVTYPMRYAVIRMGDFKDLRNVTQEQLKNAAAPGGAIKAIDVIGYVDCITITPFGYFKMGPSFILTLQK